MIADLFGKCNRILLEQLQNKREIVRMSGINFMIDERGKRTAVIIDLKRHKALWEDLYDTMLVEARKSEPRETLDAVRRRLKRKRSSRA